MPETPLRRRGFLDFIEWLGNKLPEPATLFVIGAAALMVISHVGVVQGWSVQPVTPRRAIDPGTGAPGIELVPSGDPLKAVSLLDRDGLHWAITSMVTNFVTFPPLGIILVGMLGVGVAERTGFIAALLKAFMLAVPRRLMTPTMVFLGVNASLATDAGYIVLPPLAAALYKAAGRSPLVGIAAVFAGIAGGFNANLLITSLDPLLAGLTQPAAQLVDPAYTVNPACNWYFMIASTFLLTFVGWWVTDRLVEPRLRTKPADDGGPVSASADDLAAQRLTDAEIRGLRWGSAAALLAMGLFLAAMLVPGAPLHGRVDAADPGSPLRWPAAIVPMIFIVFLVPGLAYGVVARSIRSERDVAKIMTESMVSMAPVIVLSFFAAQFLEYFKHSNLGGMMAMRGGKALAASGLPPELLIVAFIGVVMLFDLLMASMSAKWMVCAPIFVPMFMLVGISPELTQCAYRIGDSVANTITPLNAYLIVILAVVQKYAPRSGMGTLVSMMLPYAIIFAVVWAAMLVLWMQIGAPLGPGGPLEYLPRNP
ncbi:MAG: AbgT family transporter [Phycisphaerales bacterium]